MLKITGFITTSKNECMVLDRDIKSVKAKAEVLNMTVPKEWKTNEIQTFYELVAIIKHMEVPELVVEART